jgi:hypothetical protein
MRNRLQQSKDIFDATGAGLAINVADEIVSNMVDEVITVALKRVLSEGKIVVKKSFEDDLFQEIVRQYHILKSTGRVVDNAKPLYVDELDHLLKIKPATPLKKIIADIVVHKADDFVEPFMKEAEDLLDPLIYKVDKTPRTFRDMNFREAAIYAVRKLKLLIKNSKDPRDVPETLNPLDKVSEEAVDAMADEVIAKAMKQVESSGKKISIKTFEENISHELIHGYNLLISKSATSVTKLLDLQPLAPLRKSKSLEDLIQLEEEVNTVLKIFKDLHSVRIPNILPSGRKLVKDPVLNFLKKTSQAKTDEFVNVIKLSDFTPPQKTILKKAAHLFKKLAQKSLIPLQHTKKFIRRAWNFVRNKRGGDVKKLQDVETVSLMSEYIDMSLVSKLITAKLVEGLTDQFSKLFIVKRVKLSDVVEVIPKKVSFDDVVKVGDMDTAPLLYKPKYMIRDVITSFKVLRTEHRLLEKQNRIILAAKKRVLQKVMTILATGAAVTGVGGVVTGAVFGVDAAVNAVDAAAIDEIVNEALNVTIELTYDINIFINETVLWEEEEDKFNTLEGEKMCHYNIINNKTMCTEEADELNEDIFPMENGREGNIYDNEHFSVENEEGEKVLSNSLDDNNEQISNGVDIIPSTNSSVEDEETVNEDFIHDLTNKVNVKVFQRIVRNDEDYDLTDSDLPDLDYTMSKDDDDDDDDLIDNDLPNLDYTMPMFVQDAAFVNVSETLSNAVVVNVQSRKLTVISIVLTLCNAFL